MDISRINSETAKNGYFEEGLCCEDLNFNETLKMKYEDFFPRNYGLCQRMSGGGKADIASHDNLLKIQVKKFKINQFQQVDRHWISDIVVHIPQLKSVEYILKEWCEIPLKECNKIIDKSVGRKTLDTNHFSHDELGHLMNKLNCCKRQILEFAFCGVCAHSAPNYLVGVEYINKKRHRQVTYRISDITSYLQEQGNFEIAKSCSVIKLGDSFTLQRKGGDGGKKSSNQLQMKLVLSRLNIKDHLEFRFQDLQ